MASGQGKALEALYHMRSPGYVRTQINTRKASERAAKRRQAPPATRWAKWEDGSEIRFEGANRADLRAARRRLRKSGRGWTR